jgi:DNA-binding GntR family transcriptional regulator
MQSMKLDPRSLADRAHSELRRLILAGALPPGAPIAEEALALRLGISRTPIREALRRLTEDGLVAAGERQRARIATLDDTAATGVMAVRAALDALAASSCIGRCSPAMLDELRLLAARVEACLDSGDMGAAFAADGAFHLALGAASGNQELCAHLARIDGRVQLVRLTHCPQDPATVRTHTAMHAAVLDAIAAGDRDRAAALAQAHARGLRS